jgi:hypothetical protein
MKYTGLRQAVGDLDFDSLHSSPGPFRMIVSGFSRYHDTVSSLTILQRIRLVIAADFIAESFRPGSLPITSAKIIGHADVDAERGKRFEDKISKARAADVLRDLKSRVDALTWEFNPTTSPWRRTGPLSASIDWTSNGVGASVPAPENVRRGRTPGNMTEADRQLNRRVEILLEPAENPFAQPSSQQAIKVIEDILRSKRVVPMPPPAPPGKPQIPWTLPRTSDRPTFLAMVKALNDALGFLDADTILGTLKDRMPGGDPNWTDDFMKEWQKLEIDRRTRNEVIPRRGIKTDTDK